MGHAASRLTAFCVWSHERGKNPQHRQIIVFSPPSSPGRASILIVTRSRREKLGQGEPGEKKGGVDNCGWPAAMGPARTGLAAGKDETIRRLAWLAGRLTGACGRDTDTHTTDTHQNTSVLCMPIVWRARISSSHALGQPVCHPSAFLRHPVSQNAPIQPWCRASLSPSRPPGRVSQSLQPGWDPGRAGRESLFANGGG